MLLNLHVAYTEIMSINLCETQWKMRLYFVEKSIRQEATGYDKHAIGVFKSDDKLVGHMPIEISNLIDYFLGNTDENRASAVAAGQRKC